MEQNFQTSFIPKKPVVEEVKKYKKPLGLFTLIAMFLFLAMAISYGGLFFYKSTLDAKTKQLEKDLKDGEKRFEVNTLKELEILDRKLKVSKVLLDNHIVINPIFEILQDITMKKVRFTTFGYSISDKGIFLVKMKGEADSYTTIALQSDLFSQNKNLKEVIFSNFNLGDKGQVTFDLEFSVNKNLVDYDQYLERERSLSEVNNNLNTEVNNINSNDLDIGGLDI